MKKSTLLMAIILASLTAFSQADTKSITINKDSVIQLPKNVGVEVAKDLIRLDSVESELKIVKKNYNILLDNLDLKDSIINSKEHEVTIGKERGKNYESMLSLKDVQKDNLQKSVSTLEGDLKKVKREVVKVKIVATTIIGGLLYLIFK